MNEFIQSRKGNLKFKWTEIGYGLLWPLTRNYNYFQYDFRICIPVHPSRHRRLFERIRVDELSAADCDICSDTLTVYLYNAMFPQWFKNLPQNNVLRSPMVIGQLFRRALGIASENETIGEDDLFREIQNLQHRDEIPTLLRRAGLNGRVCEIGVRAGHNLNVIVRGANPTEFVAIDPWKDDKDIVSQNDVGMSQQRLSELGQSVRQKFGKYGERGNIITGYSFEAVKQFPDEHFDYVYIDADHSYEAVKRDIEDWYPKVRVGGILAGHDYVKRTAGRVNYGVIKRLMSLSSRTRSDISPRRESVLPVGSL